MVPLVLLVYGSLSTGTPANPGALSFAKYREVLSDPNTYRLLGASAIYASGVATVALLIGGITAWLVQRTNVPFKGVFVFLALCPAFMPPVLIVMGWILLLDGNIGLLSRMLQGLIGSSGPLFDIHSLGGMIWIGGILDVPLAFLWLWPAFAAMDPTLEEAASMARAPASRIVRTVTLPLLWPALAAAFLISFVLAIEDITVPILVGLPGRVHLLATDIYLSHAQAVPDTARASALGVLLLMLTAGLIAYYRRLTSRSERYAVVRGKGYRPRIVELGHWRPLATIALSLLFVLTVGLPLLVLLWTSLSPYLQVPSVAGLSRLSLRWYSAVITDAQAAGGIVNSLIAGVGAAAVVTLLAIISGWAVIRSGRRIWGFLDVLSFLPIAIPGLVVGLGLIWLYIPIPLPIYGTLWIIWIAYIVKFIPYAARLVYVGFRQLHPELEEAAYVAGATWGRMLRSIAVPLLGPTLAACVLYTTMRAFRELPASLLLVSFGNESYSVVAYQMWSGGEPGKTAAYGMVIIAVMTLIVGLTWRIARRRVLATQ